MRQPSKPIRSAHSASGTRTGSAPTASAICDEGMFPVGDPIFSGNAVEAGERRAVGEYVVTHVWR